MAAEEGRRHAEAAEHRRAVLAGVRRTTIVTTIMFAMAYGAAFGAIQQIPQIVPGLPEVREMVAGTAAAAGRAEACRRSRRA